MTAEANAALVRRAYEEGLNGGDLEVIEEVCASAAYADRLKQGILRTRTAFPDWQLTIEDVIAAGDRVVVRWSGRGTHLGEYQGVAPTSRQVTNTGTNIFRVADGKLVENWSCGDRYGLMQQLGALPDPPARPGT